MLKWRVKQLKDGQLIEHENRWTEPFAYDYFDSPEAAAEAVKAYVEGPDCPSSVYEDDFVIVGVCRT